MDKRIEYKPGFKGFLGEFSMAFGVMTGLVIAVALARYIDTADAGADGSGFIRMAQDSRHLVVLVAGIITAWCVAFALRGLGRKPNPSGLSDF